MRLKMSSAKWRPFCLGLNELINKQPSRRWFDTPRGSYPNVHSLIFTGQTGAPNENIADSNEIVPRVIICPKVAGPDREEVRGQDVPGKVGGEGPPGGASSTNYKVTSEIIATNSGCSKSIVTREVIVILDDLDDVCESADGRPVQPVRPVLVPPVQPPNRPTSLNGLTSSQTDDSGEELVSDDGDGEEDGGVRGWPRVRGCAGAGGPPHDVSPPPVHPKQSDFGGCGTAYINACCRYGDEKREIEHRHGVSLLPSGRTHPRGRTENTVPHNIRSGSRNTRQWAPYGYIRHGDRNPRQSLPHSYRTGCVFNPPSSTQVSSSVRMRTLCDLRRRILNQETSRFQELVNLLPTATHDRDQLINLEHQRLAYLRRLLGSPSQGNTTTSRELLNNTADVLRRLNGLISQRAGRVKSESRINGEPARLKTKPVRVKSEPTRVKREPVDDVIDLLTDNDDDDYSTINPPLITCGARFNI